MRRGLFLNFQLLRFGAAKIVGIDTLPGLAFDRLVNSEHRALHNRKKGMPSTAIVGQVAKGLLANIREALNLSRTCCQQYIFASEF
jgi:hypothetical protein